MSMRINKLKEAYNRNEVKIQSLQTKNKKLAERIHNLENEEIISAVRGSNYSVEEFLEAFRDNAEENVTTTDLEDEKK